MSSIPHTELARYPVSLQQAARAVFSGPRPLPASAAKSAATPAR